jgi:hypothetical protein
MRELKAGLEEIGSRVFEVGARQFHLVLAKGLKPMLRDESGHIRDDRPSFYKQDDPGQHEAVATEWRLLKNTLKEAVKTQAERLEKAMLSGRRWSVEEFRTSFLRHPFLPVPAMIHAFWIPSTFCRETSRSGNKVKDFLPNSWTDSERLKIKES